MSPTALPALLTITTPVGVVEVRGPHAPPAGLMRGVDIGRCGSLDISGLDISEVSATYLDTDGRLVHWEAGSRSGPILFEDTTYHLWVDGTVNAPLVQHRDPLFVRDITHHTGRRIASGTFNLGRQVGKLPFTVAFGPWLFKVELEVTPTKIDYATDYQDLISDVAATARGLALAYLRATHQTAARSDQTASEIEWLTLLRQEITDLQHAIARINERPHRHLLREVRPTANYKIRRLDAVARRAIIRGKGTGPTDHLDGIGSVRRVLDSVNAVSTLDTPEHRWLQLQVRQVHRRLRSLAAMLDTEARRSSRPIGERRLREQQEISQLADKVEWLLETDCLRQAQQLPQQTPPSLTMLSAAGYRDAYRILTGLRVGLAIGGDALELQTKDVHDLYELWAYLEIVKLVVGYSGTTVDHTSLIRHYSGGLRVGLQAGTQSSVPLSGDRRSFTISYNRTYPGQTGDQKPDIVIRVEEPGRPDLIVVFDAKYRVDATAEFRVRYGAPGPPIDAINALHRYRDAIVTTGSGTYRPVVRCAALFPLTNEETTAYESSSNLYASLDSVGIGALPFLPGNTTLAADWLQDLLDLPAAQLAWNGPPGPTG